MSVNEDRAQELAAAFRENHGLGLSPVKDVFELVHTAAGVDVLSMEASEAEHGLSMLDPATGRVVIAVATTRNPMRQRSSVAHELGHVLAGDLERPDVVRPDERTPAETRADAFARHLLLPVEAVRSRLAAADQVSIADLSELVQEFEVSPRIASIQMRTAGLISAATCSEWGEQSTLTLAARFGWRSQYRTLAAAAEEPRAPQSLMTRAVEGYRQGALGIAELASWYGQGTEELRAEIGPPPEPEPGLDDAWDTDAPLFPEDMRNRAP